MFRLFSTFTCVTILLALAGAVTAQDAQAQARAPWVGTTLSGKSCEGRQPTSGPYDYLDRAAHAGMLRVVEENHFDKGVESLTKGMSTSVMGDIHFVLQAFPNHHRALRSAMNFTLGFDQWPQDSQGLPVECYLQRAINFSPRDATLYKLFGYYMHRRGKLEIALKANEQAMNLLPGDVMLQYNTALILVDLERYDEALKLAKPLYNAGLTIPGLKNKLVRAGAWEHSPEEIAAYKKFLLEKAAENAADAAASDPNSPPPEATAAGSSSAGTDAPAADSAD